MNHSFDIDLAKEYGIEEAIILENFAFWIKKNSANNINFIDGNYWTFNSASALEELFPYMNLKKIQRILNKLEELNILKSANHNKAKYDRTKWYCIVDKNILEKYKIPITLDNSSLDILSNGTNPYKSSLDKMSNAFTQNVQPIPDVNTDININNKTCTCKEKHVSFENILGNNEKGFPCKDKWEKFLVDNLKGIHYQPEIEKAIKKLEKKETEKTIQNYLINTYNLGIEQNLSLNLIATTISNGKIIEQKPSKTITTTKSQEIKKPVTRTEKINFMKEELGEDEIIRLSKNIFDEIQLDGLALENELGNLLCKKYNEKYLNKTL